MQVQRTMGEERNMVTPSRNHTPVQRNTGDYMRRLVKRNTTALTKLGWKMRGVSCQRRASCGGMSWLGMEGRTGGKE